MIRKGIILSGGSGTRLRPLTFASNKQLLPIYDKPMIYYPLSVLMLANIRNILIITNPEDLNIYKKLLGNGSEIGIEITYEVQKKPAGLPDAFIVGEKFIQNDNVALILGDNFFYGARFSEELNSFKKFKSGAHVYLHTVSNPEFYGVAILKKNKIYNLVEKPKKFIADLAITGLYLFDKQVSLFSKELKNSKRNELEITDLLKKYLRIKKLKYTKFGRGFAWLDSGNPDDLFKTSEYVSTIENRQGIKIACLEEIAYNKQWITKNDIKNKIKIYGLCHYSDYLKKIITK